MMNLSLEDNYHQKPHTIWPAGHHCLIQAIALDETSRSAAHLRDVTNYIVTWWKPSLLQPLENTPGCHPGREGHDGTCTPRVTDARDYPGRFATV